MGDWSLGSVSRGSAAPGLGAGHSYVDRRTTAAALLRAGDQSCGARSSQVRRASSITFSVYEKGEPLLRKQLGALSTWHLVNIILAYELSDQGVAVLNNKPPRALIDIILSGVRKERDGSVRQR